MTSQPGTKFDSLLFEIKSGQVYIPANPSDYSFRSASLLKPLYAWAAHGIYQRYDDIETWAKLAGVSIVTSDNDATTKLWERDVSGNLLDKLRAKTNVDWEYIEGYQTWGSIRVNSDSVARAYVRLMQSPEPVTHSVLDWMRQVSDRQTFGSKQVMAQHLLIDPDRIAAKAGWFIDKDYNQLHSHVILMTEISPEVSIGLIVLSTRDVTPTFIREYLGLYSLGADVLDFHIDLMSVAIQQEVQSLLESAGY